MFPWDCPCNKCCNECRLKDHCHKACKDTECEDKKVSSKREGLDYVL